MSRSNVDAFWYNVYKKQYDMPRGFTTDSEELLFVSRWNVIDSSDQYSFATSNFYFGDKTCINECVCF